MADPDDTAEIGRLPLVEEVARVLRRRRTCCVRVAVTTSEEQQAVAAVLRHRRAEVERVPIGREVEAPPPIRQEGDTLVVPVVEERVEMARRLVLTEEVRLRLRAEEEAVSVPVALRRQSVLVERQDAERTDGMDDEISDEISGEHRSMTRTLIALFDSRREADRAAEALRGLNVQVSNVQVHDSAKMQDDDRLSWSGVGSAWLPEEDRPLYDEGMRRGGAIVTGEVAEGDMELAMDAMEAAGAVDLESREAEWRSQGWSGVSAHRSGAGSTMSLSAPDGTPGNPPGTMASRGVDKALGTNISGAHPEHEAGRGKPAGTAAKPGATGAARPGATGKDEVIPLAEERLSVGKRVAHGGRVRVRAYTVETPVEEQVRLREEHVRVERHAADRPATGEEQLFRDRVIEAEETVEEPVVRKEARVTGEVRVNKETRERTETVQDRVRRTEVDVDESGVANDPKRRGGKGAA